MLKLDRRRGLDFGLAFGLTYKELLHVFPRLCLLLRVRQETALHLFLPAVRPTIVLLGLLLPP
jgi:hypothetical protein